LLLTDTRASSTWLEEIGLAFYREELARRAADRSTAGMEDLSGSSQIYS
jgi:hypothetical protein